MKITKTEVMRGLRTLAAGAELDEHKVIVGTELDGDIAAVLVSRDDRNTSYAMRVAFSMVIVKLAKKHGEEYLGYVMDEAFG